MWALLGFGCGLKRCYSDVSTFRVCIGLQRPYFCLNHCEPQNYGHGEEVIWLPTELVAMSWLAGNAGCLDAAIMWCRFIAVPDSFVNMIPTDIRGITRNRTPQQIINILTLGNPNGVGGFFPNGLVSATAGSAATLIWQTCRETTARPHLNSVPCCGFGYLSCGGCHQGAQHSF